MRKRRTLPPDRGGDDGQFLDEPLPAPPSRGKTYVEYLAETKTYVEAPRPGFTEDVCAAIERVRKAVAASRQPVRCLAVGGISKQAPVQALWRLCSPGLTLTAQPPQSWAS
jgi:hypothetical protein